MALTAPAPLPSSTRSSKFSRKNKQALVIGIILLAIALLVKIPFVSRITRQIRLARPAILTATQSPRSTMVYSTKPAGNGDAKLSAKEEREWNHMAEGMTYYHNHFMHSFDTIYEVSRYFVLGIDG